MQIREEKTKDSKFTEARRLPRNESIWVGPYFKYLEATLQTGRALFLFKLKKDQQQPMAMNLLVCTLL
jgi:hypothetical protein